MRGLAQLATTFAVLGIACFHAEIAEAGKPAEAKYRYHYVSLDQAELPDGFTSFTGGKVVDSGKVYGTVDDLDGCSPAVAVWQDGRVRVLVDGGEANTANDLGTAGGLVWRDCANFLARAALFRRSGIKLLPPLPNDLFSFVFQLTNSGIAFLSSSSDTDSSFFLYWRGRVLSPNFGPGSVRFTPRVNNFGVIGGTYVQPNSSPFNADTRAFRLGPFGVKTLLDPRPTEPISWGESINNRGDVLGYSFIPNGREAIGVWRNRPGNPFQTYFVEGTPEFPTVSNDLLWNEPGLIVITGAYFSSNDPDSYIVPRPGVRLNLADITDNLPVGRVTLITDLNDRGDLLGFNFDPNSNDPAEDFLLQRVGDGRVAMPTLNVATTQRRPPSRAVSWRISHPELLAPRTHGKTASMTPLTRRTEAPR